jgi:hypothetical protein
MRVKFVISALILLAIAACLPGNGQAYVGPPYLDPEGYPSEHPWQHEDSPGPGDTLNYPTASVVIVPIGMSAVAIRLIQEANYIRRSSDRPPRLESDHVRKLQFRNKR